MQSYKINFRISDAVNGEYERLDRAVQTALFGKLSCLDICSKYNTLWGAEYRFRTAVSLVDIMAASHFAAHSTGKNYVFTVVKQKRLTATTKNESNRLAISA